MNNRFFPNWVTANTIIDTVIDEFFEVTIKEDKGDIRLSFFPYIMYGLVPKEDRLTFQKLIENTSLELFEKMKIEELFQSKYVHELVSPHLLAGMKHDIENLIQHYEAESRIKITDVFKGSLGVPPYIFMKVDDYAKS